MTARTQPKVAIVEDDGLLSFMLDEACSTAGYVVVGRAANAYDALDLLDLHSPDVLLFDFKIEGEQNGLELLVAAKRRLPELFSILVTGWDINDIAARLDTVQPDRILRKPVMPHVLIDLIESSYGPVETGQEPALRNQELQEPLIQA